MHRIRAVRKYRLTAVRQAAPPAARASSMHSRRAAWRAASFVLPELPFGNFFAIRPVSGLSGALALWLIIKSNAEDSKLLNASPRRLRSVPSRNNCAAKLGPMRIGPDASKQREGQKYQPVISVARPLLNSSAKAACTPSSRIKIEGERQINESRSSPCIR